MSRHRESTEHSELLFGIVAHTLALSARMKKKDGEELEVRDFMPSQAGKPKPVNHENVADLTRKAFAALMAKQEQAERIKQTIEERKQQA